MLWPCEDAHAASEALQSMAGRMGPELRGEVRAHFDRELSAHALGLKMAMMYEDVLKQRPETSTPSRRPEETSPLPRGPEESSVTRMS